MTPVNRRTVLMAPLAVAGLALTGCTDRRTGPLATDPDRHAMQEAVDQESGLRQLLGRWKVHGEPAARTDAVSVVDVHLGALVRALGVDTVPSGAGQPSSVATPPPGRPATTQEVATAARSVGDSHLRAAQSVSGPAAQLLASIGASDLALARAVGEPR